MSIKINQYLLDRERNRGRDISVIEIDGNVISGYFEYSFVRPKEYVKEPSRSNAGIINDLNAYSTFITPKLRIKFNAMSIDTYRVLMNLIEMKNEFTVGCYDFVRDKWTVNKMYFYPNDYPEIYQYNLEVLAIMNYTIELIGTNASLETVSIVYHSNPPDGIGGTDVTYADSDIARGMETIIKNDTISGAPPTNYRFVKWNDKADGSGFSFIDGDGYTINNDLVLYAQWEKTA